MKLRNCQRVFAVVFLLSVSLVHGHLRKTNFEPTSFVADGDPAREEGLEVNRTGTELPLVVVPVAVMPETLHIKKRGEGYAKGSPLYDKQERAEGSHATRPEPVHNIFEPVINEPVFWILGFLLDFILLLICAFIYDRTKRSRSSLTPLQRVDIIGDWQYGLLNCSSLKRDWHIFLTACCCPAIRWSDTVNNSSETVLSTNSYWVLLIVFFLLAQFSIITCGISGLILLVICVVLRQKLRAAADLRRGVWTWFTDCLTWSFCCCCAIVQEAREVDKFNNFKSHL